MVRPQNSNTAREALGPRAKVVGDRVLEDGNLKVTGDLYDARAMRARQQGTQQFKAKNQASKNSAHITAKSTLAGEHWLSKGSDCA